MNLSDETLMAYADDEVDEATRKVVETAMREDPEVAARVARHRALRATVSGAFSSIIEEPIPERLLAAARQRPAGRRDLPAARPDNVVSFAHARGTRVQTRQPSWRPYALAASVLVGLGLGYSLWHDSRALLTADASGDWVARGALSRALSEQLSSDRPAGGVATVGLSYRSKSGDYCRTFSLTLGAGAGVACRQGNSWRVKVLASQPPAASASADYRAAGSALSPLISATVEGEIQGDALDQAAEIAARKNGWVVIPGR